MLNAIVNKEFKDEINEAQLFYLGRYGIAKLIDSTIKKNKDILAFYYYDVEHLPEILYDKISTEILLEICKHN